MKKFFLAVFFLASISVAFAAPPHPVEQTLCPVMEGNPIKKEIFVEYHGKKVFFCCDFCKSQFQQQPEKYLPKLPQFSATPTHHLEDVNQGSYNGHLTAASLIVPFGIGTFVFLTITLLTGFFMKKHRKILFPWHWKLAALTFLLAVSHVISLFLGHQ